MGHTGGRVVFAAVTAALLLGGGCKGRTAPGNAKGFAATAGGAPGSAEGGALRGGITVVPAEAGTQLPCDNNAGFPLSRE